MNTNRVTLTAFGTSGVLLAASLTMLAIVGALVTFDAWPTRNRAASPAEIAVQNPHAARVVRSVRRASASTGSGAAGGVDPGLRTADAARLPDAGPGGGGNPSSPNENPPPDDPTPTPHVGPQPPGEDPDVPDGSPPVEPASTPPVVDDVTSTACDTVSSVAGAVVGSC
jgi:hypothetical protein